MHSRHLRFLTASLVAIVVILGATSCSMEPGFPTATPEPPTLTPFAPTPTSIPPTPTPTPPAPTPELVTQSYSNPALGISLSYPVDWLFRETEKGIVFGTSQQVIAGGELTAGAGLALFVDPLPDAGLQNVEELCVSQASVFASEAMELSDPQPRNIGGQDAAVVTLQGTPGLSETQIRGLVAATIMEGWAYTFVALSVADEWAEYGAILERMVDGVQFIPREGAEYVPDVWEPDDSLARAHEIEIGLPQTHDLHMQGDRDYLYFPATRGHVYTMETANLGDEIDTKIYLYDDEGKLLAQNDDDRSLEELWASRLIWTAEKTNTLYLLVQDVGNDDAGPGTAYDIRVWEEVHFVEDEFEPDDSAEKATMLEVGSSQPHNLHLPGDHDWIRFEATAGNTYVIETFNLGSAVDTVLHLFSEEENELALDDNGRGDEESLASRIQWTARRDVSLYIMAHDSGDEDAGPGTEYWIRLLETWP